MSDIFKNLSIHSSSSSLNSLFFSLCLVMYSRTYIIFFWQEFQSPRPSFVGWIGVTFQSCEHFGSKFVDFFFENAEDVVGVISQADVAVLTCNFSDIFF